MSKRICEGACPVCDAREEGLDPTRREVAQVEEALESPTPIDPADIRPGDVVRIVREVAVTDVVPKAGGEAWINGMWVVGPGEAHLVSRPDPDAEAIEVMEAIGMTYVRTYLDELRKRGWDVVRRAES